jgi:hypothetical protein
MDIPESRPNTNWISIIRAPGSARSNDFKKAGMTVVKKFRPEWLKTELINILRWEDDGGKIIGSDRSTLAQKRTNPMNKRVGLWLDRNKAVIVSIANNIEAKSIITSDMEHYVLYSTTAVSGTILANIMTKSSCIFVTPPRSKFLDRE